MADRGKVMKGLKQHLIVHDGGEECVGCPYSDFELLECERQLYLDVEELLKAPEPRVLSLEEATEGECWFEYINGSCGNADDVYMKDNKTAIIYRTNSRSVQVLITDYMKKWRCWSYRPTVEQRKEVKWDD